MKNKTLLGFLNVSVQAVKPRIAVEWVFAAVKVSKYARLQVLPLLVKN